MNPTVRTAVETALATEQAAHAQATARRQEAAVMVADLDAVIAVHTTRIAELQAALEPEPTPEVTP